MRQKCENDCGYSSSINHSDEIGTCYKCGYPVCYKCGSVVKNQPKYLHHKDYCCWQGGWRGENNDE